MQPIRPRSLYDTEAMVKLSGWIQAAESHAVRLERMVELSQAEGLVGAASMPRVDDHCPACKWNLEYLTFSAPPQLGATPESPMTSSRSHPSGEDSNGATSARGNTLHAEELEEFLSEHHCLGEQTPAQEIGVDARTPISASEVFEFTAPSPTDRLSATGHRTMRSVASHTSLQSWSVVGSPARQHPPAPLPIRSSDPSLDVSSASDQVTSSAFVIHGMRESSGLPYTTNTGSSAVVPPLNTDQNWEFWRQHVSSVGFTPRSIASTCATPREELALYAPMSSRRTGPTPPDGSQSPSLEDASQRQPASSVRTAQPAFAIPGAAFIALVFDIIRQYCVRSKAASSPARADDQEARQQASARNRASSPLHFTKRRMHFEEYVLELLRFIVS